MTTIASISEPSKTPEYDNGDRTTFDIISAILLIGAVIFAFWFS